MIYLVAYKQLKHQLQRVLGKDIRCISMDYPLEEGYILTSLSFPDSEDITLVIGNDIAKLALSYQFDVIIRQRRQFKMMENEQLIVDSINEFSLAAN